MSKYYTLVILTLLLCLVFLLFFIQTYQVLQATLILSMERSKLVAGYRLQIHENFLAMQKFIPYQKNDSYKIVKTKRHQYCKFCYFPNIM